MKKITLRSLIAAVSIGTAAQSMEPSLDTLPQEVQLALITSQDQGGAIILNIRDISRLLQVSKQFRELAQDGKFWMLLSKQDGFSVHSNTAYNSHYHYLKGLNLKAKNPKFSDIALLDDMLVCFNKGAPFMHLGAIDELLSLMDSPLIPLEKKCIFIPEDLDLETCPLLSGEQILNKTDEKFLQLLSEYDFLAIRDSQKIRERFFQLLKERDLAVIGDMITGLFETFKKGSDLQEFRLSAFSNFEKIKPGILKTLEISMKKQDLTSIDLIIFILAAAKGINEDSDGSSECSSDSDQDPFEVGPILEKIENYLMLKVSRAQMSDLPQFIKLLGEGLYKEYTVMQSKISESYKQNVFPMVFEEKDKINSLYHNNDRMDTTYNDLFLSIFQSGNCKPLLFEEAEHFLYIDVTPREGGCEYNDYIQILKHEINVRYPALCFYQSEVGGDSSYLPTDANDNDTNRLLLRKTITLFESAKITFGNCVNVPQIHSLTSENMVTYFDESFCQKHLGFKTFSQFQGHLLQGAQPKLLKLIETVVDKEALVAVYSLLTRTFTFVGDHKNALKYANRAYDLGLLEFFDIEHGDDFIGKPLFYAFLNSKQFMKAKKILDLVPPEGDCKDKLNADFVAAKRGY